MSQPGARVAVVLKGWPRLSETFIAQEIAGLEARGVALEIWSLRRPTDKVRHPVHDRVEATSSTFRNISRTIRAACWRAG